MDNLSDIINKRMSRRSFTKAALSFSALSALPFNVQGCTDVEKLKAEMQVARGYDVQTVIRWGDPILPGGENLDPYRYTARRQKLQFGYNCDYIAYLPINGSSEHGLLCVNHETSNIELMIPDITINKRMIDIEMAAHGHSVVEIKKVDGKWETVVGGKYNRRITPFTEFEISGPAAQQIGTRCTGTVNNCGGGKTPWGTLLICEENFNQYFTSPDSRHERYKIGPRSRYKWHQAYPRFAESDEAYKFGWVCEFDPFNPDSVPVKRTALGRFFHEGADCVKSKDGKKVVVYSGDDERWGHLYKYIGEDLDNGTLYAAKFDENKVTWLPIPTDRLLNTRDAAKDAGATFMDRPEDIRINPKTNEAFAVMTGNLKRRKTDPANPRARNLHGHIIRLTPDDHADLEHEWDIYMYGDEHMSRPDNINFDSKGRMWIATDGMLSTLQQKDGVFMVDEEKQLHKILSVPYYGEPTGPEFTPDGKTLFVSIQHPGGGSTFANPSTRWPDFEENMPPRPSVVAIDVG